MSEKLPKYTARIPIIPDSLFNKQEHKINELVMDRENYDIYVKTVDGYHNITGTIRESVEEIQDGSVVIELCTEDTLPNVKDRKRNHWYYVITKSKEKVTNQAVSIKYIYYGAVDETYYEDKSYMLIAHNMITDPDTVKLNVPEGYRACFYIPVVYLPTFTNTETNEEIKFSVQDRLYVMNPDGTFESYDVYMSDQSYLGEIFVSLSFIDNNSYTITIKPNYTGIGGYKYKDYSLVRVGNPIGALEDPSWTEYRYVFRGWSLEKANYVPFDPATYIPRMDTTIYAYFDYVALDEVLEYNIKHVSTTGRVLKELYTVGYPNAVIEPLSFEGYVSPTNTHTLTERYQVITFTYTPIEYNITYNLDGGRLSNPKTKYTIEDIVTPDAPTKEGYAFDRWRPFRINRGTTGDFTFTASWTIGGILVAGATLRSRILALNSSIKTTMTTVETSIFPPEASNNAVEVSTNSASIKMWYNPTSKSLKFYSEHEIQFNSNSEGIFEGFTKLRTIDDLESFKVPLNFNIKSLFKGCISLVSLSSLESWGSVDSIVFDNAFTNTGAANANRLPSWYVWPCTVRYFYESTILKAEVVYKTPNATFYPTTDELDDYTIPTVACTLTESGQIFDIQCTRN